MIYDDDAAAGADGLSLYDGHDSYVLIMRLKKQVRLFEEGATMQRIYIHGVFTTIKNYLLSLYRVRVLKPLRISHFKLGPLL